jgi:hypothetical protein
VREIAAILKAIHAGEDTVATREKAVRVVEELHALSELPTSSRQRSRRHSTTMLP